MVYGPCFGSAHKALSIDIQHELGLRFGKPTQISFESACVIGRRPKKSTQHTHTIHQARVSCESAFYSATPKADDGTSES